MHITVYTDYPEDEWESMQVYSKNLIRALRGELSGIDTVREYTALPGLSALFPKKMKFWRYIMRYIINPIGSIFAQGNVNHIIDQSNAHLLRFLNPDTSVITCHDLIVPLWEEMWQKEPEGIRSRIRRAVKQWRIQSLSRARIILTVSEFTKRELIERLGISPDRIVVTSEGVEPLFKPIPPRKTARILKKYGLPKQYLLHVGTNAPYKNIPFILRCFEKVGKTYPGLHFVKVGHAFSQEENLLIRTLSLEDKVMRIPWVPRADLPAIYAASRGLIHLSHIEGFGLTVLEAMATGTPVFVSDIPVMHEIAGDAGWYVSPAQETLAVSQLVRGLKDKRGCARRIQNGLTRAARFTWRRCAQKTVNAYGMLQYSS